MSDIAKIEEELLRLSPRERERLALKAWESLVTDEQAVADSQIDPDGVELAESRDAELDGGNVEALDEGEFRRRTDGSE